MGVTCDNNWVCLFRNNDVIFISNKYLVSKNNEGRNSDSPWQRRPLETELQAFSNETASSIMAFTRYISAIIHHSEVLVALANCYFTQ